MTVILKEFKVHSYTTV